MTAVAGMALAVRGPRLPMTKRTLGVLGVGVMTRGRVGVLLPRPARAAGRRNLAGVHCCDAGSFSLVSVAWRRGLTSSRHAAQTRAAPGMLANRRRAHRAPGSQNHGSGFDWRQRSGANRAGYGGCSEAVVAACAWGVQRQGGGQLASSRNAASSPSKSSAHGPHDRRCAAKPG